VKQNEIVELKKQVVRYRLEITARIEHRRKKRLLEGKAKAS